MSAQFTQPNFTTQSAAQYKAYIDAAFAVHNRLAGPFAAHQQDVGSPQPDLSIRVDAGQLWNGTILLPVAAQSVSGFTTPTAGQHRIDRVVMDAISGVASRVAGVAATGSPTAATPAIPAGSIPICQVLITSADVVITNSMITDERAYMNRHALLSSKTASASATISFTPADFDWTAYALYVFEFLHLRPATNAVGLQGRISDDDGATWENGASAYSSYLRILNNAANALNASSSTLFNFSGDLGTYSVSNSANYGVCGRVYVPRPSVTVGKVIHQYMTQSPAQVVGMHTIDGAHIFTGNTNAWNGMQFFFSSGNITSGTINAYGRN